MGQRLTIAHADGRAITSVLQAPAGCGPLLSINGGIIFGELAGKPPWRMIDDRVEVRIGDRRYLYVVTSYDPGHDVLHMEWPD